MNMNKWPSRLWSGITNMNKTVRPWQVSGNPDDKIVMSKELVKLLLTDLVDDYITEMVDVEDPNTIRDTQPIKRIDDFLIYILGYMGYKPPSTDDSSQ